MNLYKEILNSLCDPDSDFNKVSRLSSMVQDNWDSLSIRFNGIKEIYALLTPEIKSHNGCVDPYFIDWSRYFTPIESNLWQDIRSNGLPFFPQYPVAGYFVDFGDPVARIALEADGKQWHDKEKDEARDRRIQSQGWRVIRYTGARTYHKDCIDDVCRIYGLVTDSEYKRLERLAG